MPIVTRLGDEDRSSLLPRAAVESSSAYLGLDLRININRRGLGDVRVLKKRHLQTLERESLSAKVPTRCSLVTSRR